MLLRACRRFASSEALKHTRVRHSPKTECLLDRTLRVDHAGEFGAVQIYKGQLAVLGHTDVAPTLQKFLKQEETHLLMIDSLARSHRVRPSALLPLWRFAGYALGAGCAMLGKEGAMACTVAVETVIGEHYDSQIRELLADGQDGLQKHKELMELLSRLRDDELAHMNAGLEHGAEQAPFYSSVSEAIKLGCQAAIWLSKRL